MALTLPKKLDYVEGSPDVFLSIQKILLEKYFKNSNLGGNGTYSKFTVLVHLWAKFTPGKPKILPKTKISAKTAFLGLSNNVCPKSQKNQRSLVISIKSPRF